MDNQMPILQLEKISKKFGSLEILKDVDLAIHPGESVSIVGPSGAGKSTLLHVAGLMEKPSGGAVIIQGQSHENMAESETAKKRLDTIGFLFQFHFLLPDFDVLENVLIPCRLAEIQLTVV